MNHRQPGRVLAVLMASAVVVLKHETPTLRQRHNFISIDFKFGVVDYVCYEYDLTMTIAYIFVTPN